MGGGDTVIQQPEAPQAPSVAQSMADYVNNLPALYQTQMQYLPQFAQLSKSINDQLYPTTAGLQEKVAAQAQEGMNSQVPDWMKQSYINQVNSQLGTNAGSPIGADYVSRGLLEQQQGWKNYYTNLALSAAGRQPLVNAPDYQTISGGFTPQSVMGYNSSNYGTQAGIYANQNNAYANSLNQTPPWMNMVGAIGGTALGVGASAATGGLSRAGGFLPKII